MSDEETTFNREFDVTKAMRDGQASADRFMDNVAEKAAKFDELFAALQGLTDMCRSMEHAPIALFKWPAAMVKARMLCDACLDDARALQQ